MDYCGKSILANYFRGLEAVGGKIYFDDKGFTFKSHALNVQTGDTRIEYIQISNIKKRNTMAIVSNGISVFTKNGFEHKFVINNRKRVIEYIQRNCNQ